MREELFADPTFLNIGEVIYIKEPLVIRTVLGSCLSVIFWSSAPKISSICHAIYAGRGVDTWYVVNAIEKMDSFFKKSDVSPANTVVKLFGGAQCRGENQITISAENHLRKLGYSVTAKDTGEDDTRVLYFISKSGDVYLKKHRIAKG